MNRPIVLEPAAQGVADASAKPPFLYEIGPERARAVLDEIQAAPIAKLDVAERWVTVPADGGDVRVRIVTPPGAKGPLPTILYMHGGGWVLGNAGTHDRLVRELAVGARAALVFVEYTRSPEAHHPVAIEQGWATARWIVANGAAEGLDARRLAVAGDSVGGNMAAVLAILAKQRGGVTFVHQSLYYPVTDAGQDTQSYADFANGPFLTAKAMAWFWDCYLPDRTRRADVTASPLRATPEQLAGLPPCARHRRRERRAAGRGRGVRAPAHAGRGHDDQRALQRHPPRLHDAQSGARHAGHDGRDRAGRHRAAEGARDGVIGRKVSRPR
jgi:acetyl esterase/lipase